VILIVLASRAAALAAYLAYRNGTDGQGGALSGILILYGLVGAGTVWGVDAAVRRIRR
jgi:hypothetical protein